MSIHDLGLIFGGFALGIYFTAFLFRLAEPDPVAPAREVVEVEELERMWRSS